jgi:DNA end-binding protein Ku
LYLFFCPASDFAWFRCASRCGRSSNYALGLCSLYESHLERVDCVRARAFPVNLHPATESQSISSNLLHKKDHSRIRYQRVSEATGKEVPAEEIVRGFEVERDNFVVISDDELKEAAPEKSAAIEIQEFVNESQIPTLYFEKPYYLEPDKGAGKAYALLREALAKSGKVGVAQFVLRNRESLCVLKAQGDALTLNTLRFASEIRSADELRLRSTRSWPPTKSILP